MLSLLHAWERDHLGRNELIVPARALYQEGGRTHVVVSCPLCSRDHTVATEAPFGMVRFGPGKGCKHRVSAVIDRGTPAFTSEAGMQRYAALERESDLLWRYAQETR